VSAPQPAPATDIPEACAQPGSRSGRKTPADSLLYASAMVCVLIAGSVIAGWHLRIASLIQYRAECPPMQYNTAVCFLLAGIALLSRRSARAVWALAAAAAVGAIGLLTLAEYAAGIDLHIDRLFFTADFLVGPRGMRMAPNTALAFACAGAALVLALLPRISAGGSMAVALLASLPGALGLVTLVGLAMGLPRAYQWQRLMPMSLPAGLGFVALSSGALALAWRERADEEAPNWLPVSIGVALATVSLLLWHAVALEEQGRWWVAETVLALGLLMSGLVSFAVYAAQKARRRARQLQAVNLLLEAQIEQRQHAEQELTRLNRSLRALSDCNQILVHATEEKELLQKICRVLVEQCGYSLAWVGYAEQDEAKTVRAVAAAGARSDHVQTGMVSWAEEERGGGPAGAAIRTGRATVCQDMLTDASFAPWRERALERGFRSCIALPLLIEGKAMGALSICAPAPAAFEATEVALLTELAQDLSFGIQTLRTRAERDRAEQRLRYLALIVEDSEDAIYSKSLDGTIVSWNRGAEETYGYAAAEAVGRNVSFLFPPERGNELAGLLRQVAEGANVKNYETVRLSKNGARREVSVTLSPLHDRQGRVVGVSSIARDISERKRAERELERYAAELQRSNAELQDFASIASHDLQEPLRKVLAFGGRLQEHCGPQLDDTGRDFLRRMQNAAARMSNLIEALLQYSRVSTRAQPFQPVDLQQAALEVVADLETSIQEAQAQVSIGVLPRLVADRTQMWQLLQNLLSNAIKFHRPGAAPEVWIDSQAVENDCWAGAPAEPAFGSVGWWEIRVRDNGIGFEEKHFERIFRPFQRLHGRSEYAGSGMGLAICRKIVARHGGSITATSQPGQGATFVVTLPAVAEERSTSWSSPEDPSASCLPKTMTTITS